MKHLTLAVLLSSAAALAGSAWEGRLAEAQKKALAERKKLGLDDDKARAAYPSPEVRFGARGEGVAVVCPGKSAQVKGKGKLKPGSTVLARTDEVEVSSDAVEGGGYQATVKVKAGTPPGPVSAEVAAPVSFISETVPFVFVGCTHTWRLELSNGEVLTLKSDWVKAGPLQVEGEWSKGGKAEGKTSYTLTAEELGSYSLARAVSQAEQMSEGQALMAAMGSKEMKALQKRQEVALKKLDVCSKQPPAQMGDCMKAPSEEMKALSAEMEALLKAARAKATPPYGCSSLSLQAHGGKLKGDASGCVGETSATVTGGTLSAP